MRRKSQASLEFLTTYSWAILALLITMSALYYFGIFDFSKYLPQKCVFSSQMQCLDFVMLFDPFPADPPSPIFFKLVNNLGEEINVGGMEIINNANPALECVNTHYKDPATSLFEPLRPVTPLLNWEPGTEIEFRFSDCEGGGYIEKARIEAKITMKYCAPATFDCVTPCDPLTGCPEHIIIGKLSGRVT